MIKKQQAITVIAGICMLTLILDSRLVLQSAYNGIILCLRTVIPSLFPFLIVSGIITGYIASGSKSGRFFLEKLLGIPHGAKTLVLLGFLGGYPNGAQNVYQIYKEQKISKEDAERMLPICNNAGPAFIFGMLSTLFSAAWIPWILWGIQIIATIILAIILPGKSNNKLCYTQMHTGTVTASLQSATRTMAYICGWVVLFRIILSILEFRLFAMLPQFSKILICGIFELTNGIHGLTSVSGEGVRFLFASVFLSLGGLCVLLQTKSVVSDLSLKIYCIGKALHALIALALSISLQPILFRSGREISLRTAIVSGVIAMLIVSLALILKKTVAIPKKMLYNDKKSAQEV